LDILSIFYNNEWINGSQLCHVGDGLLTSIMHGILIVQRDASFCRRLMPQWGRREHDTIVNVPRARSHLPSAVLVPLPPTVKRST